MLKWRDPTAAMFVLFEPGPSVCAAGVVRKLRGRGAGDVRRPSTGPAKSSAHAVARLANRSQDRHASRHTRTSAPDLSKRNGLVGTQRSRSVGQSTLHLRAVIATLISMTSAFESSSASTAPQEMLR